MYGIFLLLFAGIVTPFVTQLPSSQARRILIFVEDMDTHKGVRGVRVAARGYGGISKLTTATGRTMLTIPQSVNPGDFFDLQVVAMPRGYVLYSPLDGRITVPSLERNAGSFAKIVLRRRDHLVQAAKNDTSARKALLNNEAERAVKRSSLPAAAAASEGNGNGASTIAPRFTIQPPANGTDALTTFQKGQAAFISENWTDAVNLLTKSLTEEKLSLQMQAQSWSMRAVAEMNLTNAAQAKVAFETALKLDPYDSGTWISYAALLVSEGRYADAAVIGRKVLEMSERASSEDRAYAQAAIALERLISFDFAGADAQMREAVVLARSAPDMDGQFLILAFAAIPRSLLGKTQEGLTLLDEAETSSKEIGTEAFEAQLCIKAFRGIVIAIGGNPYQGALLIKSSAQELRDKGRIPQLQRMAELLMSVANGLTGGSEAFEQNVEQALSEIPDGLGGNVARANLVVLEARAKIAADRNDEADRLLEEAEKELVSFPDHPVLSMIYLMRGELRFYHNCPEAIGWFEKALRSAPKGSDVQFEALEYDARCYATTKGTDKAEELAAQSLHVMQSRTPVEDAKRATHFTTLAMIEAAKGKRSRADELFGSALEIERKVYGESSNRVDVTLFQQAKVALDARDLSSAKHLFNRCLDIEKALYGTDHPEVARTEDQLAWIAVEQYEYDQALRLYSHMKDVYSRAFGPESVDYAWALVNIAYLEDVFGEDDLASKDCEVADKIMAFSQVNDVFYRVEELNICATVDNHSHRYQNAEQTIRLAINFYQSQGDKDWYRRTLTIASETELNLADYDKAVNYAKEALDISEQIHQKDSRYIDARLLLVRVLIAKGLYGNAVAECSEILPLANIDRRRKISLLSTMADAYQGLGDKKKALQALTDATSELQHMTRSNTRLAREVEMKRISLQN